ncbi:hypothetical protein ACTWPT_54870 [Nonomuraea sp. 3N208]|uniref:hypothetical protein n=1 Tax=Nonomuraea sp. 3N208 TaxID=3457421 RepID=UPI003FCF99DD
MRPAAPADREHTSVGLRRRGVPEPGYFTGSVEEILTEVALVLMMTVDRSFGDQEPNPSTLDKVRRAAGLLASRSLPVQTSRWTGASTNRPSLWRSTPG